MNKYFGLIIFFIPIFFAGLSAQDSQATLPASVHTIAESCEDIIDLYVQNNWVGASMLLGKINQVENDTKGVFVKDQMPQFSLNEFEYFIFRLNELTNQKAEPLLAALTANQVTAILMELEVHYARSAPIEISLMDYYGREIVLLSKLPKNYGLLNTRINQLQDAWTKIKPVVDEHGGTPVSLKVDDTMAILAKHPAPARIAEEGNRILDLVDELEGLFSK